MADDIKMSLPIVGQIIMFSGNFAPQGWALCNGQSLLIAENSDIFSIIGTTYGGNGQTTFKLPDLRGRIPIGTDRGAGLSPYSLGQVGGAERIALKVSQLPKHSHSVSPRCSTVKGNDPNPQTRFPASSDRPARDLFSDGTDAVMGSTDTSPVGQDRSVENRQPFLTINFIIALVGDIPAA